MNDTLPLFLGIDQSTSATKVVLFDTAGNLVDKTSRDHVQIYPQAGWVEHDPEQIWQNLLEAVGELLEQQPDKLARVSGVSIANQRETFVVFERESGIPLHNAIVWQCRRGAPICEEFSGAGHDELVVSRTGLKLDTYFPAAKLTWLMRENPTLAERSLRGRRLFGTIDTYLIYRLTGGLTFATDSTNASRTLLFDVQKLGWDDELCELFGVPPRALAEVRSSDAAFGETDFGGLLDKPLPIRGVMGDSQASLFAQRCYQPGQGKATFGTGTSIMVNVGQNSQLASQGTVLALAWVLGGEPTYALEGLINYSSATIAWLRDQLKLLADPAESETLATSVEDNGGVYFVPAFAGLSAPYWDPRRPRRDPRHVGAHHQGSCGAGRSGIDQLPNPRLPRHDRPRNRHHPPNDASRWWPDSEQVSDAIHCGHHPTRLGSVSNPRSPPPSAPPSPACWVWGCILHWQIFERQIDVVNASLLRW